MLFVQKLAVADGTPIWTRTFGTDDTDEAHSVSVAPDGNVLVTGYTYGALAGSVPVGDKADVFALKLSSDDGSIIWQTQFGPGYGYGVAVDSAGDVFVVADAYLPAAEPEGEGRFTVRKLSGASGAEIWTRRMGQSSGAAHALTVDASDDVLVAGNYDGVAAVMKLDGGDGARLWLTEFTWAPYSSPAGLAVTPSGTVLVTGTTEGNMDSEGVLGGGFVLELSGADGTKSWVEQFGVIYKESPREVAIDGSGDLWLAGARDIATGDSALWNSLVAKIVRESPDDLDAP